LVDIAKTDGLIEVIFYKLVQKDYITKTKIEKMRRFYIILDRRLKDKHATKKLDRFKQYKINNL